MKNKTEKCPEELTAIKQSAPKKCAGGALAVSNSLKHIQRETGFARGAQLLSAINQKRGFDCPSCAWPDPDDHRAPTEFCENGAKAIASEGTQKRITRDFFHQYSIQELGDKSDYWHELQGRLTEPMFLSKGSTHYEPITWESALSLIAEELKSLPSADDAIFYTSGRASNEAAFLYQLLARQFGTNNLPDCSNMCHESSGVALNKTIGIGKGTVKLHDFYKADVVLIIGQNPGTNHPRMLSALQTCVRNGGKIIAINPLKEAGLQAFSHPQEVKGMLGHATSLASTYLQVKTNGDHALLKAIAKGLIEGDHLNLDYIAEHTKEFESYKNSILAEDWKELERISGIKKAEVDAVVSDLAQSEKIITCWAMGVTQHKNAVSTIEEIVNLHLLRGALGKPHAGLCPVRGHSNVQGDRTMGIFEKMPDEFLDKLEEKFHFKAPRKHGYDTVDAIHAMHKESGKVFIALGGNFLSATPDTDFTAQALRQCTLTVHISTKLNRSHLVTGKQALILPCLGRSELDRSENGVYQFLTVENSMGIVHTSKGKVPPASEQLLGEPNIIAKLAEKLLDHNGHTPWREWALDYSKIRDDISHVIAGFENYNERVQQPGGFYLPNHAREGNFEKIGGSVPFSINVLRELKLAEDQLLLMTIRSHDQFNTTIYGMNDRYRGIKNERRVLFMNTEDMATRKITNQQLVDITSEFEGTTRKTNIFQAIEYDIPKGCAAAYFPEANVLVPLSSTAEQSNTPTSKSVAIRVALHK
ncbi:MAG: FdhF/YdeP family oxidoreductase [Verrucomicrobiota bacterium]